MTEPTKPVYIIHYDRDKPWWRRRYFVLWIGGKRTRGFTKKGTAHMADRYLRSRWWK